MMICARCGLPSVQLCDGDSGCKSDAAKIANDDAKPYAADWSEHIVACRDRELANLRSLLRSVTGKLERAAELCGNGSSCQAGSLIIDVLEVLS